MKRIICLFLILKISPACLGQEKSENKKIISVIDLPLFGTDAAAGDDVFLFNPKYGIEYRKVGFYLGPSIRLISDGNTQRFTGGMFSFRVFPNGRDNRFNFFFENDFTAEINKYFRYYYFYSNQSLREEKISNFIGYGFCFNPGKHFFLSSSFALGVFFSLKKATPPDVYYYGNECKAGGSLAVGLGWKM